MDDGTTPLDDYVLMNELRQMDLCTLTEILETDLPEDELIERHLTPLGLTKLREIARMCQSHDALSLRQDLYLWSVRAIHHILIEQWLSSKAADRGIGPAELCKRAFVDLLVHAQSAEGVIYSSVLDSSLQKINGEVCTTHAVFGK